LQSPLSNFRFLLDRKLFPTTRTETPFLHIVDASDGTSPRSFLHGNLGTVFCEKVAEIKGWNETFCLACPQGSVEKIALAGMVRSTPIILLRDHIMPLFVGDLASVCTEADLMKAFSRFGAVLEVKLMRDHRTKQSLLYGFVTFMAAHQSEKAMAGLDGELLCGRRLK
jgi:hypothetical protein